MDFSKDIKNISNTKKTLIDKVSDVIESFGIRYPLIFSMIILVYAIFLLLSKNYMTGVSYLFLSAIFYILLKSLKDKIEFIDRIMAFTIILILLFTLLTFIVAGIAIMFAPIEIRFGDIESWIGFSGSILGSSITMFALVFAMRHERLLREEDSIKSKENEKRNENEKLEMQKRAVMPIPFLSSAFERDEFLTSDSLLNFKISNKSQNGMFLKKIVPLDSEFASLNIDSEEEKCILFKPTIHLLNDQLIPSECQIEFQVSILEDKEIQYDIKDNKDYRDEYVYDLSLSFEVIFSDVLEIQEYSCLFVQRLKLIDQSNKSKTIYRYFDSYINKTTIPKRI